ncbi:Bro-N domain-containing protein [Bilophila wadsworthia]|uniref:BRO-N domain-containing protein n=1 Tax=Bilophila wadsworthia TaxID=35833 RepID=UPI00399D0A26
MRRDSRIISEPGLYSLVLRSRKPEAKAFKRWIVHEVIPSIRRTGGYDAPALPNSGIRRRRRGHWRTKKSSGF